MFKIWNKVKITGRYKFYLTTIITVYIVYICFLTNNYEDEITVTTKKYLINTSGCTIENIDVYSPDIKGLLYQVNPISCTDKPLLTYTTRNGYNVKLNINKEALDDYSYFEIQCCYVTVKRNPVGPAPDDNLIFSECIPFKESVIINEEVVKVKCTNIFGTVYENVHAIIKSPEEVPNKRDPNVILIGIDGVSRSNFIRTMPKTYRLLKDTEWINLKGYNKVEDNTFPNLIAVLAGTKFSYHEDYVPENCDPYDTKKLEGCDFIWKTYKRMNYSTAYAEDTPKMSTFNSNKAGFVSAPTDHYFRPYFLTLKQLTPKYLCLNEHCTGPEKTGIRMQNLILDFLEAIKEKTPGIGLFWMNTFSHEDFNCPTSMDEDFKLFFKNLANKSHMENTIIIFYSDHGFRYGKIRLTATGWMEERLPFIYIWIPKGFRKSYKEEYHNIRENSDKLTSPYDLYMTFQHILSLSDPNFIIKPAQGCPQCHSLLKKVKPERTCKDAGIPQHYCTCSKYEKFNRNTMIAKKIAIFFVDELNKRVKSYGSASNSCASFSLDKISYVKKLIIKPGSDENYLIGIVTNPEANFEATVKVTFQNGLKMALDGVNRLDRYAPTSYCAKGSIFQMYCYCRSMLKKLTNIFCNNKYCFL